MMRNTLPRVPSEPALRCRTSGRHCMIPIKAIGAVNAARYRHVRVVGPHGSKPGRAFDSPPRLPKRTRERFTAWSRRHSTSETGPRGPASIPPPPPTRRAAGGRRGTVPFGRHVRLTDHREWPHVPGTPFTSCSSFVIEGLVMARQRTRTTAHTARRQRRSSGAALSHGPSWRAQPDAARWRTRHRCWPTSPTSPGR